MIRDASKRRAMETPAASSQRKSFPIPTMARRGLAPCRFSSWCSEVCQELGDIIVITVISNKLFFQHCMFPIFMGHGKTFELTVNNTLTTVHTTVLMILQHITFCRTVKYRQFNRIRWTILHA